MKKIVFLITLGMSLSSMGYFVWVPHERQEQHKTDTKPAVPVQKPTSSTDKTAKGCPPGRHCMPAPKEHVKQPKNHQPVANK